MNKFLLKDDDWIGETCIHIMHGTLFEWFNVKKKCKLCSHVQHGCFFLKQREELNIMSTSGLETLCIRKNKPLGSC